MPFNLSGFILFFRNLKVGETNSPITYKKYITIIIIHIIGEEIILISVVKINAYNTIDAYKIICQVISKTVKKQLALHIII
jgi:hypothetical protein